MPWLTLLLVMAGGAVGTGLRYAAGLVLSRPPGSLALPWSTWLVNVAGSFFLGFVAAVAADRRLFGAELRVVVGTGVLGGFTTYSSFNLEALELFERGAQARTALYVGATLVGCLCAGAAGLWLGRTLRPGDVS
jgi:CrcB protein